MNNEISSEKYIVRSSFEDIILKLPINWRQNPFSNKNWVHHFMSLRWALKKEMEPLKLKLLLTDFYNYHVRKGANNPHYNTIRGDHTAAERVNGLCFEYERFKDYEDLALPGVIIRLLKSDINNLLSEEIYRAGHNHALMVDKALVKCAIDIPKLRHLVDLNHVLNRAYATLSQMFYEDGVTRENSISYQEYNFNIVNQFCDQLTDLDSLEVNPTVLESLFSFLNVIKSQTKVLLGYALRENDTYLELGDTFSDPKLEILSALNNNADDTELSQSARDLLAPYSSESGYYCKHGLVLYRHKEKDYTVHFGQTVMYGSNNHKQDDELSFCLCIDNTDIFIDAGYNAIVSQEEQDYLKSSFAHSTLNVIGSEWISFDEPIKSNSIQDLNYNGAQLSYNMTHERIKGFTVHLHTSIEPKSLTLNYSCTNSSQLPILKLNRFILSVGCSVEFVNSKCLIVKKDNCRVKITVLDDIESITVGNAIYTKFNGDMECLNTTSIDILYYCENLKVKVDFLQF